MGALEMQNLSVLDNRAFLVHHLSALRALPSSTPPALAEVFKDDE
jgi:hypothetical protein